MGRGVVDGRQESAYCILKYTRDPPDSGPKGVSTGRGRGLDVTGVGRRGVLWGTLVEGLFGGHGSRTGTETRNPASYPGRR